MRKSGSVEAENLPRQKDHYKPTQKTLVGNTDCQEVPPGGSAPSPNSQSIY